MTISKTVLKDLPPGPYSVETNGLPNTRNGFIYLLDANGRKIGTCWGSWDQKNALAEFIVGAQEILVLKPPTQPTQELRPNEVEAKLRKMVSELDQRIELFSQAVRDYLSPESAEKRRVARAAMIEELGPKYQTTRRGQQFLRDEKQNLWTLAQEIHVSEVARGLLIREFPFLAEK